MILLSVDFQSLHEILRNLYNEMMPFCSDMVGIAKGIAGLGALFYIANKVWGSLANAEPIEVYPLLRPFAIGFCIMFFQTAVLGTINTVLSPVVKGTHEMLESQTFNLYELQEEKNRIENEMLLSNPSTAYLVSDEEYEKKLDELGWWPDDLARMMWMGTERLTYQIRQWFRKAYISFLETCFLAASLTVDTIRTFFLIVLSILGPIAFALSIYDGFQSTLIQWLTRYINVYFWLPVSDLLGALLARLQGLIIQNDINNFDPYWYTPESSDVIYIIFMIIGIIGYFTVPTVSAWIVQAGGLSGMNRNINKAANTAGAASGAISGNMAGNMKDEK